MAEQLVVERGNERLDAGGKKRLVVVVGFMALTWAILLIAGGSWRWLAGWLFIGLQTAVLHTVR